MRYMRCLILWRFIFDNILSNITGDSLVYECTSVYVCVSVCVYVIQLPRTSLTWNTKLSCHAHCESLTNYTAIVS